MKTLFRRTIMAGAAMLAVPFLAAAPADAATELRIMWYSDANEGDVMRDLLDRFEKANPDIKVALDRVPYKTITDNLPALVSSGQAPDMARVTDLGGQSSYYLNLTPYLKDKAYWDVNFKDVLPWVRPPGETDGVYGLMTQLTITMPIVNETLFQQAGIPLPGPMATWDDWAKAAKAVATKLNVPIPIAIDRSGHRIAGPAISYGAKFFSPDGQPALVDAGLKTMATKIYGWHNDGVMSKAIWGSVGGAAYRGANEEFSNGQVVLYMSGSWQFAQFVKTVGDGFDWHGVANPCGPASCSGMPGGAALVAYKTSKHPAEIGKLMDYLASEPVYSEFHARTLFLTAHKGLMAKGIPYAADKPQIKKSLDAAFANVKALSPVAYQLQGYRMNRVLFTPLTVRLNQANSGEMTLDDAFARMTQDMQDGLKAAGVK